MSAVAVLGLGAMGSRLAVNYAAAGHDVTVWNRTAPVAERLAVDHGLATAATPRAAASGADVVVSMVAEDEAASDVWLDADTGALDGMHERAIAIESSTLTPAAARRLGAAAEAAGIRFVEAPVVGSRPQADAGALLYLLGGDAATIDEVRAIIDVNAGKTVHVGGIGAAATMKLAVNGLFAAQVAAYAEIVGFLERSEVDTGRAIDTLTALPITSPGLQRILGLVRERDYAPNFPVRLVAKDLRYLTVTADELGAAAPIMGAARSVFERGADGEERDLDIAGIARRYHA